MRILVAGDTHGDLVHLQYLIDVARKQKCDRVFVVGDFGYWAHLRWGIEFLDKLDRHANITNMPVYFIDGNHDKTSHILANYDSPECTDKEGFLLVRSYVRYAKRGHRWTWDGVKFIALGGAYSVDKDWRVKQDTAEGKPGNSWFPEEEMTDQEMEAIFSADATQVDVIMAHDKPLSSTIPFGDWTAYPETVPNQQRLDEAVRVLDPALFLHGHLHVNYRDELWHSHRGLFRDVHVTTVIGLNCNARDAAWNSYGVRYEKDHSWMVLDTNDMEEFGKR